MEYAIGVDGGGTGCRVAIVDRKGTALGEATNGPANIATNIDLALTNICAAIEAAAQAAQLGADYKKNCAIVLGLAGANVGSNAQYLTARLPFSSCLVVSDALTSLDGALGGTDGTGAMIGTGSVFASRMGRHFRMLGGWGFQLGDQGSGAVIGRSLLQETLLAHDRIRSKSSLTERVMAHFGSAAQISEFARHHGPQDFSALAPMVLEEARLGDGVAIQIVTDAARYIAKAVDCVSLSADLPVTMIGGLSASLADYLPAELKSRLIPAAGNALDGAKRMALKLAAGELLPENVQEALSATA